MSAPSCRPFQTGAQQREQRHTPAPLQQHGVVRGRLPSSVYRGAATALQQAISTSVPAPASLQERSLSSSSSGRSAAEERALKVHSEAERRRRERINAHLATLRRVMVVPDSKQMDKATLLATAISQLKDLRRKASEITHPPPVVPAEADSVTVHCHPHPHPDPGAGDDDDRAPLYVHASVSCDDRPGLLADIATAVCGLRLRPLRADVASLGGRTRCSFVLCTEGGDGNLVTRSLEEDVRQVLAAAAVAEMARGCGGGSTSKRQRVLEPRALYSGAMN